MAGRALLVLSAKLDGREEGASLSVQGQVEDSGAVVFKASGFLQVEMSVFPSCLSVHLSVRFEVLLKRLFAPTSQSRMSNFFWNPWGKVMERSGLSF